MAKVLLILATVDTPQPATQTFGGSYLFKIGETAQIATTTQAEIDGIDPGTWAASCQSLDTTGAPIADMATCTVIVPDVSAPAPPAPSPAPGPAPAPSTYPAPSALSFQIIG